MKNLFQLGAVEEVMTRMEQLKPSSQPQWGRMDVAQMLAHCSTTMDMASGKFAGKRVRLSRVLAKNVRPVARGVSRMRPTDSCC